MGENDEQGSVNFFGISRRLVGARRFELLTPCAQVVKSSCDAGRQWVPDCDVNLGRQVQQEPVLEQGRFYT